MMIGTGKSAGKAESIVLSAWIPPREAAITTTSNGVEERTADGKGAVNVGMTKAFYLSRDIFGFSNVRHRTQHKDYIPSRIVLSRESIVSPFPCEGRITQEKYMRPMLIVGVSRLRTSVLRR